MKKINTILMMLFFWVGYAQAAALPINQIPMYGNAEKTEQMKASDASFIASIEKSGYSHESGAAEVVRVAFTAFQKGDMKTAITRFNQAWLLDPENGNVYHGFALIKAERDSDLSEAEKFFRIALAKKNVDANAYVDYGRLLWMQNRLDESLELLQKALVKSPTAYNARSNMAFVYYKQSNFIKACEFAQGAKANQDQLESGFLEEMCKRAQS